MRIYRFCVAFGMALLLALLGGCSGEPDAERIRVTTGHQEIYFEISRDSLTKGLDEDDISIRRMSDEEVIATLQSVGVDDTEVSKAEGYDLKPDGAEFAEVGQFVIPFDDRLPIIIHLHRGEAEWVQDVAYEISSSGNRAIVPISRFSQMVLVTWEWGAEGPFSFYASASDARVGESVDIVFKIVKDPRDISTYKRGGYMPGEQFHEEEIYLWDLPAELRLTSLAGGGAASGYRKWEDVEFYSDITLESSDIACHEEGRGYASLDTYLEFMASSEGKTKTWYEKEEYGPDGRSVNRRYDEKESVEKPASLPRTISVHPRTMLSFNCLPQEKEEKKVAKKRPVEKKTEFPKIKPSPVKIRHLQFGIGARASEWLVVKQTGETIANREVRKSRNVQYFADQGKTRVTEISYTDKATIDGTEGRPSFSQKPPIGLTHDFDERLETVVDRAQASMSTKISSTQTGNIFNFSGSFEATGEVSTQQENLFGLLKINSGVQWQYDLQIQITRPYRILVHNCRLLEINNGETWTPDQNECYFEALPLEPPISSYYPGDNWRFQASFGGNASRPEDSGSVSQAFSILINTSEEGFEGRSDSYPVPNGPIPIPYPNTGKAIEAAKEAKQQKIQACDDNSDNPVCALLNTNHSRE